MRRSTTFFIAIVLGIAFFFNYSLQFTFAQNLKNWAIGNNSKQTVKSNQTVQLALLLDTSGSMDGLIEQAKSQLWKIVNELNNAEHNNETPNLEIALYEYGNDRLSRESGYIAQIFPFTRDMDLVSEKLFALTTNGGSEYCGEVIATSLKDLEWSADINDLKLIYIAGNEEFNQGTVSYKLACKSAKNKDIIVNTIFCGEQQTGIKTFWKDGADLAGGNYMNIDQNVATRYIDTPYDDEISSLNDQLNTTYVAYGSQGYHFQMNQTVQDKNADKFSKANKVDRAVFKSSKNYANEKWDFVDAYKKDKKVIKNKSKIPSKYKGKSTEEIEKLVQEQLAKRKEITKKIKKLSKQRTGYITAEQEKLTPDSTSLERSVVATVKKQAKEKGYKFKK